MAVCRDRAHGARASPSARHVVLSQVHGLVCGVFGIIAVLSLVDSSATRSVRASDADAGAASHGQHDGPGGNRHRAVLAVAPSAFHAGRAGPDSGGLRRLQTSSWCSSGRRCAHGRRLWRTTPTSPFSRPWPLKHGARCHRRLAASDSASDRGARSSSTEAASTGCRTRRKADLRCAGCSPTSTASIC